MIARVVAVGCAWACSAIFGWNVARIMATGHWAYIAAAAVSAAAIAFCARQVCER